MTSVEKRRSSRRSCRHRKHSDGGFSDTSSGGSYLDENDREVCSLTDRAFRSLCIGDEAVYNDSELNGPSPSTQRDRQLAFSQSSQDMDIEGREREELKRVAHENFNLRMQQYEQDWFHGEVYVSENHRDRQMEVHGDRTQGRVSATFQHSYMETSRQGNALREKELSFLSNGASEFTSQQRRSRSRVSSLIRAFNSDGQLVGTGMDDKLRQWDDETSWDKSALMSIQKELSEFSTSYQQNFDSRDFPSVGPFSFSNTNYSSSEAVAHMSHNSASSYMKSSHIQNSMSAQVSCNSNFFIHSEFSPFKVWRDHNRFPFQQGNISGFMHCSEFPKWYETPMYKELSLENQSQSHYRSIRHPRNNLAPVAPPTPPRSTSTSSVLQKASAVGKRCESELAVHYPHRKRAQSLGNHKLPSQRPSTASPTIEMSRRVKDTITSVKALQQKIKMMTEQSIATGQIATEQGGLYRNNNMIHPGNSVALVEPNAVHSSTSTTPFNISQLLTPVVHTHQEAETPAFQQYDVSPQPVEHPPVRAESRGSTPDVRTSSYKSRATSLLFNLKDNRKRVKSTYSPTKFKGLDTVETNNKPSMQEPRENVTDSPDPDSQFKALDESSRANLAVNPYHSPGLSLTSQNFQPTRANTAQYPQNISSDYQTAQIQGQMVSHSGFSGSIPVNYTNNQLVNGQNPHEYLESFTPYNQGMIENVGNLGGFKQSYMTMDSARLNTDYQSREYLIGKANAEQAVNETVGRVFTKVDRYEQLKHNTHDYNNMSSQNNWRPTKGADAEKLSLKDVISPYKQETTDLKERSRQENQPSRNKEPDKVDLKDNFCFGTHYQEKHDLVKTDINNQMQERQEQKGTYMGRQSYDTDQDYRKQLHSATDKQISTEERGQMEQYMPVLRESEKQRVQKMGFKPQFENNPENVASNPADSASGLTMRKKQSTDRQNMEDRGEKVKAEHMTAQRTQAELAKAQQKAQVEQPKAESAVLNLAEQTGSETVKTEVSKSEPAKLERKRQAKEEPVVVERMKGNQTEQVIEGQLKVEQLRAQKLTDEATNITEKVNHMQVKEEQDKQVRAKPAQTETQNDDHIKIELAKNEQTGPTQLKQVQIQPATREMITAEQAEEGQQSREPVNTEKMEAQQIKTKISESESKITQETEQTEKPKIKAKYETTKDAEVNTTEVEDVLQVKDDKVALVNAYLPKAQISTSNDTKLHQPKLEENKVERTKAELSKADNLLEKSAKLTAKLSATQPMRSEPDRVEHVKTELAKAKAELAKIKEKMRGDQKEKASSNIITKESAMSNINVPAGKGINKNIDYKSHDQIELIEQTDKGTKDNDIRDKYGLSNSMSTEKNKVSDTESDADEAKALALGKTETGNNEKLKNENNPTRTSGTTKKDNKEDLANNSKASESKPVYNQSSKGLNLSSPNSFAANNGANESRASDNLKVDSVEKLEKYCSPKDTVSMQRDSDSVKLCPVEGKLKSSEHSVGPGKDLHATPVKALCNKERAQTKQEILTSKIKAHAEKEISAIKEKGFALRDGFIGKGSSKPLGGSQSVNIRQKPPSQEVPKKHESTSSTDISEKPQLALAGLQTEPAINVIPPNSDTRRSRSAATNSLLADQLEKSRDAKYLESGAMSKTEGFMQKEPVIKSPVQNKEQTPMIDKITQQENHEENHGKECQTNEELRRMDNASQVARVKAESSGGFTTENTESEQKTSEGSAPPHLVIGQIRAPLADDNLKIMGIMVTVRERTLSLNIPENNGAEIEMKATEKECNKSELPKRHPGSGQDENTSSKEANLVKAKTIEKMNSTAKADQVKVSKDDHPENNNEASTMEAKNSSVTGNFQEKKTSLQKENPTINANSLSGTQPALSTDKNVPLTFTNDAASEKIMKSMGQIRTDGEKNQLEKQSSHTNETIITKVADNGISNDSAKTVKQNLSVKEEMSTIIKDSKSRNQDYLNAAPPHRRKHDHAIPKTFSSASPVDTLAEKKKESCEDNDDVHIDCIAIRVVQALTEKDVAERQVTTFSSNVQLSNEYKQEEEKASKTEQSSMIQSDVRKEKESMEDEIAVQNVLSSVKKLSDSLKSSSKEISNNGTKSEPENERRESNVQAAEGDYFQVQGATARGREPDTTRETELHGLTKKTAMNTESSKERKGEVFVFKVDQGDLKEDESHSGSIQDENIKKKKMETGNTLDSKKAELSVERWNNDSKREGGQDNHAKKNYSDSLSSLPAIDQQSSHLRNARSTMANTSVQKPDGKPKERVSTIPEISAIADYARLKVIVSEDKEVNKVQEFPPNKKEGFFPLIQTRHSRRPVFTTDPQDLAVKDANLPNKTEMSAKASKEPKTAAFPIMEKEHQRTGMFKLRDKDKQDTAVPDIKGEGRADSGAKISKHKDTDKSTTPQKQQTANSGQQKNNPLQATGSSSPPDMSNYNVSERLTYLGRDSPINSTLGDVQNRRDSTGHREKDEMIDMQGDKRTKTGLSREDQLNNERLTAQDEETKPTQEDKRKLLEKDPGTSSENETKEEHIRIKQIIQETRASLAEEERRAIQREEERRAKEREAIAIMVKERRQFQRQAERRGAEEQKENLRNEDKVANKSGEMQTNQQEETFRVIRTEGQKRVMIQEEERVSLSEQQVKAKEEQQSTVNTEEKQRRVAKEQQRTQPQEEIQGRDAEEKKRRAAKEEQKRREAEEQQQRRAAEEQKRREVEEQQRRATLDEQQRREAEEQRRRATLEEQQRREAEEQRRRATLEEQQRREADEQKRRAALEEQQRREAEEQRRREAEEQKRRAALEEQQRREAEEQRRKDAEEQQRRAALEEQQRRESEEQKRRTAEEQKRREAEEQKRREAEEQKRREAEDQKRREAEEQKRRAALEDQKRREAEEQHRRAALEEQQRREAEEQRRREAEDQKRREGEDQKRREAEEQKRRAAEEQKRREAEDQKRREAEEQKRRAALQEQKRREVEDQKRREAEEQHRRAALEEQQRREAVEQKRREAEEQRRRAALEEQKRREAEEQWRREALEEQQRREVMEQKRREAEEQKRRAAQEEQMRREAEEQRRRETLEEQQRRKVEELKGRAAEERKRREAEEQQRRGALEEQQRRAAKEEQKRRAAEEQQIKVTTPANDFVEKKRARSGDEKCSQISENERIMRVQEHLKAQQHPKEQRKTTYNQHLREELTIPEKEGKRNDKKALEKEKNRRPTEESSHESMRFNEEKGVTQEFILTNRDNDIQPKKKEGDANAAVQREKSRAAQMEMQKRAAQRVDAIQYYAITSTDTDRKLQERQQSSPLPSQQRNPPHELESGDDLTYYTRPYRPYTPASPAPSLPRSNTSSPALGAKPSMFRVKDNTIRGSPFTKSVKPRFHKNYGEDLGIGPPTDRSSDRGDDEQEIRRRSSGTPVHPDTHRLAAVGESSGSLSLSSSQDYSTSLSHHRPYSRRSIVMDEDESRSVISNMSEDMESFATSAADLADVRSLFDFERPESACSFSSDVSRSMGKPPAVPPKSEKALRRAQRLTSRRIKKELSKAVAESPAAAEKEASGVPSSSSTEWHSTM
ncbi:cardiac-enriched FHL2-interacting protein isoform 2-T2 [Menidia menidia]